MGSRRLDISRQLIKIKMKAVILLSIVAMTYATPGGYTAKGGVYDFRRQLDYKDAAVNAGKFAWNKKFESELETGDISERGERNAPAYIPTFFTSQQNHEALTHSRQEEPAYARPQRQIEPLYYETYHTQSRK